MSVTDPIADMLTCVRNACQARHRRTDVPYSNIKLELAKVLLREKYVANFKVIEDGTARKIRIYLKYTPANEPVMSHIERISRPGCRVYVGSKEVQRVLGGLGISIMTTPRGVMTGSAARKENVGGELLCKIW